MGMERTVVFRDSRKNVIVALAAAGLAIAFAVGLLVHEVAVSSETAVSAKNLAEQIQRERARNIRSGCVESNARNRNTKRELDRLISELPARRRERAQASSAGTRLLIDALAPVRDCDSLVERQVPGAR
jgi:hypothetical protein